MASVDVTTYSAELAHHLRCQLHAAIVVNGCTCAMRLRPHGAGTHHSERFEITIAEVTVQLLVLQDLDLRIALHSHAGMSNTNMLQGNTHSLSASNRLRPCASTQPAPALAPPPVCDRCK